MDIKRIAVIGISASGKTTFSRLLAKQLNLPLIHMDTIFWKSNWEEVPEEEYLQKHSAIVDQEKWIIEGYVDEKMKVRLEKADLIIYLDYSGLRCAIHLIIRWLKHRRESRPELPREALERLDKNLFWLVLTRGERRVIENVLVNVETKVLRYSRPSELKSFSIDGY